MTPDAAMAPILAAIRAAPAVDMRAMPLAEARALTVRTNAPWQWSAFAMAATRELALPGPAGPVPARLHVPAGLVRPPVIVYAHGGGWTFGTNDTHDGTMRTLAGEAKAAVLGVDYRLAPEHPFPAPLDDVMAAIAFVESGGLGSEVDSSRIALAGDSAGATLALGALIARRDLGLPPPLGAALFYGCNAPIFDTDSHRRLGDGAFVLQTAMMRWYWSNYLGAIAPEAAPGACAPLHADLAGLPPLHLSAAGLDPLLDDTILLSAKLATAGVRHTVEIWPGVVHGFLRFARDLPAARAALAAAGRDLKHLFDKAETANPPLLGRKP